MMPTSRLAPALTKRFGTRAVIAAGLTVMAAGLAVVAQMGTDTAYWHLAIGLILLGFGMGAAMTPATSAITQAVPSAQQGVGSALNDLSLELGGAIGIAVIGSILTATYRTHVDLSGLPPQIAGTVRSSYAIASHLGGEVAGRAHSGFVDAMHIALLSAAGAALTAAALVTLLLANRTERTEARSPDEEQGTCDSDESTPATRRQRFRYSVS
jgi:MFS family permease